MPAGKELVLFLRPLSQSCEPDCLGQDLDPMEIQDILPDCACCEQSRFSVLSTDSGIERDLPAQEEPCAADTEHSRLHRKGGIKKKLSPLDSVAFLQAGSGGPGGKPPGKLPGRPGMPPEPAAPLQRLHTARVVLLGDDRILGRLAQAYHSLRYRGQQDAGGQQDSAAALPFRLLEQPGWLGTEAVTGEGGRAAAVSWHCPALARGAFCPFPSGHFIFRFRKRETRRVFLTPRLNLQFYHIPVVPGQPQPSAAAVSA